MFHLGRALALQRCLALLCLLLLAACGSEQQQATIQATPPAGAAQPTAAESTSQPTTAGEARPTTTRVIPTPTPTLEPGMFRNPVIEQDFPDPDLLKVGDTYYAYATNTGNYNVQVARSTDLVDWQLTVDALPSLPKWAEGGFTWAPEVTAFDNTYVMYFTARHSESQRQCIGSATADQPQGPFTPQEGEAIICQLDQGGSIDASSFVDDDGSRYVLWKNDGNCCGHDTWIYIQPVSPDGLTLQGEPTQLIKQTEVWEGNLVEAPTLWKHEGRYYLFYSANAFNSERYAVGYAAADNILGPYTKGEEPILATNLQGGGAFGPGGQDIVVDKDGETWMVYHSWDWTVTYRHMQIDEIVWEDGVPVVKGPDLEPQPVP